MTHHSFTTVGELTLHYATDDAGGGGGPLVLIHSLGCDLHLWDAVVAAFAVSHSVLRYDLRGHGVSDCGPEECTIDDHARDLDGLLERMGIAAATLVGVSIGGAIALATARRFPGRVRRLVLCATGARIGSVESWNERIATVRARGLESIADGVLGRWFTPAFAAREAALHRGWRNHLVRTPAAGYVASCAALRDADLRPELARIAVPVLVLAGDQDAATPPALGRELAAGLPRATFALIAGAAHLPPLEQPTAYVAAVNAFLAASV